MNHKFLALMITAVALSTAPAHAAFRRLSGQKGPLYRAGKLLADGTKAPGHYVPVRAMVAVTRPAQQPCLAREMIAYSRNSVSINLPDKADQPQSPLYKAISNNNADEVDRLLGAGAKVLDIHLARAKELGYQEIRHLLILSRRFTEALEASR